MSDKRALRIYGAPELNCPTMVVGWGEDVGGLGSGVTDYLIKKLGCQAFGEIEPEGFFPLSGVSVENDVARFPESVIYFCAEKNLVVFKSNSPRSDWYRFLNSTLDIGEHYYQTKEVYTIGGMVYIGAHTSPRHLVAVANSPEMREALAQSDLAMDINYETPLGQRPTLNAFLLWIARMRDLAGASLWVPVPFYLGSAPDPKAWRKIVGFLDDRLNLELDFRDLDEEVLRHDAKMAQLRSRSADVDTCIHRLESNIALSDAENEKLVSKVQEFLESKD